MVIFSCFTQSVFKDRFVIEMKVKIKKDTISEHVIWNILTCMTSMCHA